MSTQEKSKKSRIAEIIESTAYKLKQHQEEVAHGYESAEKTANNLLDSAHKCMGEVSKQIKKTFWKCKHRWC